MRYLYTLSIIFFSFTALEAQIRKNILYNQSIFLPTLISDYDSVVYIPDTVSPVTSYNTANVSRYANGAINGIEVFDENRNQLELTNSLVINNKITYATFQFPVNQQDTLSKNVIIKDINGFDSIVTFYEKMNNAIAPIAQLLLERGGNGTVNRFLFQVWDSQNFQSFFEFNFFYSNGRLDSILRTDLIPIPALRGKLYYFYNSSGAMDSVVTYETIGGATVKSSKFLLQHNALNEVTDVTTIQLNVSNQQFEFFDRYQYYKRPVSIGIAEEENRSKLVIYPNPVKDKIWIEAGESVDHYVIFNPIGEIIAQGELGSSIDVNFLPKGIYFLRLMDGNRKEIIKFMKQ